MQNRTQTDASLYPKVMAVALLALEVSVIAVTALAVFAGARETVVQTTSIAMLTVILLITGKVPSLLFRNLSLFSQNRLLRYTVAVFAVLVFLLVETLF